MIYGIGTDLVDISRFAAIWQRHGPACLKKFLAPEEQADCLASHSPERFLAKRFAAKEALAKALGTGLCAPVQLSAIAVSHDPAGKPEFRFAPPLATWLAQRGLKAQLSLSDERNQALAFVLVEVQP